MRRRPTAQLAVPLTERVNRLQRLLEIGQIYSYWRRENISPSPRGTYNCTMSRLHIRNIRLQKWFPPDNRFSTCIARLCILREDLLLEMQGIYEEEIKPLDQNTELWRKMFFWRSLVKTIAEMRQTVETLAMLPEFKRAVRKQPKEWQAKITETKSLLLEHKELLTNIRDSLGGHVLEGSVQKALQGMSPENVRLLEVGQIEGKTHFRFTNNLLLAILLADVDEDKRLEEIQNRFRAIAKLMSVFHVTGILVTIYADARGLVSRCSD